MIREGKYFLHLCLQEGCVDNVLVILKKKREIFVWVREKNQEEVLEQRIVI